MTADRHHPRVRTGFDLRRGVLSLALGLTVLLAAATAEAKTVPLDRERAAAAATLAARYWRLAGLDKMPNHYDRARFEHAIRGEDDPYNIVAAIAVATLNANPGRDDAVFSYLNSALLPFAQSHKPQYLCLVAEVLYNSQSSTDELAAMAKAKQSDSGLGIAFIDYAYFLIKTEPEREKLKLVIPADNGVPEAVAAFRKMLTPEGGALIPETAVRLDCDHQPAS